MTNDDERYSMRHSGRLATILLGSALLTAAAMSGTAVAQDPAAPSAMCSLLAAQEISDAFALEVAVTDSDELGCTYETDPTTSDVLLVSSRRSDDTLDEQRGFFEGEDIEVAGRAALFVPGSFSRELYVSTADGGSYTLQVVGLLASGADAQSAMTGLATLALSRLEGIGPLPTEASTPGPSFTRDAELEALFPTQIAGLPVTIQSMSGSDLAGGGQVPPELQAALDAAGKTLADLRIGIAYVQDASAGTVLSISAVQLKGTDMSTLKAGLLPLLYGAQTIGAETTLQLGGKDVTSADVSGTLTYFYPRDDILWIVTGGEPALSEVFAGLP